MMKLNIYKIKYYYDKYINKIDDLSYELTI